MKFTSLPPMTIFYNPLPGSVSSTIMTTQKVMGKWQPTTLSFPFPLLLFILFRSLATLHGNRVLKSTVTQSDKST